MGRALRRAVGGLLAVALLVAAGAFYVYAPRLELTAGPGAARSAEPAPGATTPPADPSTPAPSPVPTTAATAGTRSPGAGGQGPGIGLRVRVAAGGVFVVTETVRLPAPVTELVVAPPDIRAAGGHLRRARVVATALAVVADGRPVRLGSRILRRTTPVRLGAPTDRVVLRYRLRGAVRVSAGSPEAGRAIGALRPLAVGAPLDLPVTVAFGGAAVRNLSCPGLPATEQNCYARRGSEVVVGQALARRTALVAVQLDLRAAR